jgi:hypothetical protein
VTGPPQRGRRLRPAAECIVKPNAHDPLIDRPTWELAQKRLADEKAAAAAGRTTFSPRNPAYYLRPLLACGHCGKPMMGRTETDCRTGRKTVIYVCSTYVKGRCGGFPVPCGYQKVNHADAERLLLDKIAELNLTYDVLASGGSRDNLQKRLELLGQESARSEQLALDYLTERVETLNAYFTEALGWKAPPIRGSGEDGDGWWFDKKARGKGRDETPDSYDVEAWDVTRAKAKLAALTEEHAALTLKWAKATEGM